MTTLLDFRVCEDTAGAVLKQVAALEPAERLEDAPSLTQIMADMVDGLEELWENLRKALDSGVSRSDAANLGRILIRSANINSSSLGLLALESPPLKPFTEEKLTRLRAIKARGQSLLRLAETPTPPPDPERMRRSLEQAERGEGVSVEDLLAEPRV
jgi:hypothetical protein